MPNIASLLQLTCLLFCPKINDKFIKVALVRVLTYAYGNHAGGNHGNHATVHHHVVHNIGPGRMATPFSIPFLVLSLQTMDVHISSVLPI